MHPILLTLALSFAPQEVLQTIPGAALGGQLGLAVAGDGDVDNDGIGDWILGAPLDSSAGTQAGRVRVLSGADGSQIYAYNGFAPNDQFGFAVAFVGDLNSDGYDDFAIGAPGSDVNGNASGQVRVYNGKTGAAMVNLNGPTVGETFGRSIVRVGNVDLAHPKVFAVSSPYADGSAGANVGAVSFFNGVNNAPYLKVTGTWAGELLGFSLAAVDDGLLAKKYVVAGAPEYDQTAAFQGRAIVYNAATGGIVRTHVGSANWKLGFAVGCLSDFNNDAVQDYAVGAPNDVSGRVNIYSGQTGALLQSMSGPVNSGARFGNAIGGRVAVQGSPHWHFAIGAPLDNAAGSGAGRILLYRLPPVGSPVLAWTKAGAAGERLGSALASTYLSGAANLGVLLAGAPGADTTGSDAGAVKIVDQNLGSTLATLDGSAVGERLGSAVCAVGDVNGDGIPDYGVGAPYAKTSAGLGIPVSAAGGAMIRSGANGAVLRYLAGTDEGDLLGAAIAGTGDVNGDGVPDWIAGAPGTANGQAFVRSGAANTTLFTLNGFQSGSEFGGSVGAADFNHDGKPDFVIGMPAYDNGPVVDAGMVRVFSGANGTTVLGDLFGVSTDEHFGAALGLGDLNADGYADIAVGIPDRNYGLPGQGQILVFSGKTMGVLQYTSGAAAGDGLGAAAAVVGDVNGDGYLDLAGGAPVADGSLFPNGGYVEVVSGKTNAVLWKAWGGLNTFLGCSVAAAGDVDLDGRADVLAGAHEYAFILPSSKGFARVFSGATGAIIHTTPGPELASGFGWSVAGIGDVNGDGIPDAVVGSPFEGPDSPLVWQGGVRVLSLRPAGVSFYGASDPGCTGPHLMTTSGVPKLGSAGFQYRVNHAPAGSVGLLLASNAQDLAGSDFFGLGVPLYVDLLTATEIYALDMATSASGFGACASPIPSNAFYIGKKYYAQALLAWTGGCSLPPYNLSASNGVEISIQP